MSCQLKYLGNIEGKNVWFHNTRRYSKRFLIVLLANLYRRLIPEKLRLANNPKTSSLHTGPIQLNRIEVGDMVKVCSIEEIKRTLDSQNRTKGCAFKKDMYDDCEKEFRVCQRIGYFFDESKQKMCKCNNIYLLDGSYCGGEKYQCDRYCFNFWQASWLKKVQ